MASLPAVDVDRVSDILRDVAARAIIPRFRSLSREEVRAKGVDDVVTVADLEAERLVTSALTALAPTIRVIGEEGSAQDADLLASLGEDATYWLLDPLDGTANFVAGDPDIGVMLALVHGGDVVASWIWQPIHDVLLVAERGAGAFRNGERIHPVDHAGTRPASELAGWMWTRFLPPDVRAGVQTSPSRFASLRSGPTAAAVAYGKLVLGESDFSLYWRTAPWDHAPGVLLLRETGGAARRLDGRDYRPGQPGDGLLVTRSAADWPAVRESLL